MKFLNKNRALCLVPHPDDTAFSMSWTVKKHPDTIFEMLYLTSGGFTDSTRGENRYKEDIHFWNLLGVDNVRFHYLRGYEMERELTSVLINAIEQLVDIKQYDLVFGPTEFDSNYDHVLVNRLMMPLVRSLPITTVEYRNASTLYEWAPNLFVELTDEEMENKISVMWDAFPTQTDAKYFEERNIKNFHTDFISGKRGFGYSEMFRLRHLYL
jgi:LmbE family N-acetylglucosaminyl deacetylase